MILFRQLLPVLLALRAASATAWDGVFVPAPDLSGTATVPSATVLADGRVLASSGWDISLFSPQGATVTTVARQPYYQSGITWTPLPNGKVLGSGGVFLEHRAMVFDPATSAINTLELVTTRINPSVTALSDGRIMVAGGCADGTCATPLASTEIYDPATGTFSPGPNMLQRRTFHSSTLLADGRVLFYGGKGYGAGAPDGGYLYPLVTAELYDPATNSFDYTRDPNGDQTYLWWSRSYHTGSALPNGKVLLCGGHLIGLADYGVSNSCDMFIVATGDIISPTAVGLPYGSGAMDHTATVLADGTLLIAGGIDNVWPIPKATARVYDPTTGVSHEVSSMAHARRRAAAVRLLDGSVLMIGGQTTPTPPDPSLPYASYPWTPTMERYVPDDIFKDAFEH
jgi:hypothetical protein